MESPPVCSGGVDPVADILVPKCGDRICHGAEDASASGLDVITPGLADRLLEAPAVGCAGRVLVSTSTVDDSVLLDRINPSPTCGPRMPLARDPLSEAELTCIRNWAFAIVRTATAGGTP